MDLARVDFIESIIVSNMLNHEQPHPVSEQSNPSSRRISRDFKRWPETFGYPSMSGGSNDELKSNEGEKQQQYLTGREAAKFLGVTTARISQMIREGILPAEKRKAPIVIERMRLMIPVQALIDREDELKRRYGTRPRAGRPRKKS